MPQHLTQLGIDRVDLVDRPANQDAFIMLFKRDFTQDERDSAASSGAALPDGSFPIQNVGDLKNAVKAFGRAKDPAKAKAHIISRAKSLGATDQLPEDWMSKSFDDLVPLPSYAKDADTTALTKACAAHNLTDGAQKAISDLHKSVSSILESTNNDKPALLVKTFDQFKEFIGKNCAAESEKAIGVADAVIMKGAKVMADDKDKVTKADLDKAVTEAVAKAIKEKDELIAKANDELAFAKMSQEHQQYASDQEMSPDDKKKFAAMSPAERDKAMKSDPVEGRLPESVKKRLAKLDDIEKSQNELLTERDLMRCQKRAIEIGLTEADGALIQKAQNGDKEAIKKLEDMVAALTAQVKKGGLFTELGTNRGATGNAMTQLIAKRDELRKATPALTEEQAFAKVYGDPANKELVAQEKSERGGLKVVA